MNNVCYFYIFHGGGLGGEYSRVILMASIVSDFDGEYSQRF